MESLLEMDLFLTVILEVAGKVKETLAQTLFNNINSGDYTLRQDSPCKDAGIADLDGDGVKITDYNGSAPDMGAYEMVMAPHQV